MKKFVIAAAAALAAIGLTGGSALAFECFNASRSDQGNANAANARALMSLEEILAHPEIVGLCPAGVDFVLAELESAGYDTGVLINFQALMAGGLERNGKGGEKLHDGRGIDHLGEEFFGAVFPLIEEGFGICAED